MEKVAAARSGETGMTRFVFQDDEAFEDE
jgi:hypothetical protein